MTQWPGRHISGTTADRLFIERSTVGSRSPMRLPRPAMTSRCRRRLLGFPELPVTSLCGLPDTMLDPAAMPVYRLVSFVGATTTVPYDLVHRKLIGGRLRLVQRGWAYAARYGTIRYDTESL